MSYGFADAAQSAARDAVHAGIYVDTQRKDREGSSHASESPRPSGACIETSRNARPIGLRSFDKRARCSRIIVTIPGRGEPVVPLYVPLLYIPTTVLRYQSLETFKSYVFGYKIQCFR